MRRVVDGPAAAAAGIGRIFPYVFGINRGVLAIPLRTGAQGALRQAVSAPDPATEWFLDDAVSLARFPDAGTGQIGGERITWTGRDFGTVALTGITRAVELTPSGDYNVGQPIYEVIPEHIYGLFENPGAYRHASIDGVYLNGLLKAPTVVPTHTITMADTAAVSDPVIDAPLSVGTLRFDMTSPLAATSPFVSPDSLAAQQRYAAFVDAQLAAFRASLAGASVVGTYNPSAQWPKLRPQLGVVTADVTGLQDDAGGTISGTPFQLLTNPAHIARLLLQEAFMQTAFDEPSWTLAAARVAQAGYQWALQFLPMTLGAFQEAVFRQSRLHVFQESGRWRATFRERGLPVMTLTPARRVSWAMGWTPLPTVMSTLEVAYGAGDVSGTLILTSARGRALVPTQSAAMQFAWITNATVARNLGTWHLSLQDHPRRLGTVIHHIEALPLLRAETVVVDAPMLAAYGGSSLWWKTQAIRFRPDGFVELALEEEDPLEAQLPIGVLRGTATVQGMLTTTMLSPLLGALTATAMTTGALTTPAAAALAGALSGQGTLTGALTTAAAAALMGTITAVAVAVAGLSTPPTGPTLVAHAVKAATTASTAVTPAVDTTGATLLVVVVGQWLSATFGTVTDSKGNTWTALTSPFTNPVREAMFYAAAPTVGPSHTVTYSGTGSQYPSMCMAAFAGVRLTAPLDQSVGTGAAGSGTTPITPPSITPTAAKPLLIAGLGFEGTVTWSISAGFTLTDQITWVNNVNFGTALAYLVQGTAATVNPTWTGPGASASAATTASFHGA
jgi:hypothetical protein